MVAEKDVIEIVEILESAGVSVWLDGGWAVDALLGFQSREHNDLDVMIFDNEGKLTESALAEKGFSVVKFDCPTNFVLGDAKGRAVDVHLVHLAKDGRVAYRMCNNKDWVFPDDGFTGKGVVGGRPVNCLSAQTQIFCHAGYELAEKDYRDMELLGQKFGLDYPKPQK
ncbi:MAG: hypothetical protein MUD10_00630 [Candidatus Pacebacteria bacterium]|jgi:lincosamide nucleotidyltransferase A/C/D/E|nr:hypothetical protein [Candidatus Paceibacterota bacterium]